jgi:hypothetical protein
MHDLEPVSVVQMCGRPAIARHDLAVEFNGYAVRFHAHALDERGHGVGGVLLALSVDRQVHDGARLIGRERVALSTPFYMLCRN